MLDVALDNVQHRALSDDVELVRFDLRQKRFPAGGLRLGHQGDAARGLRRRRAMDQARARRADDVREPAHTAGRYNGHWTHIVHRFPKPVTVAPGDVVPILFRHDRTQIGIDLLD